ncbi:MAG: hypothetical protein P8Y82_10935 [Methyloceanibacter sp.]
MGDVSEKSLLSKRGPIAVPLLGFTFRRQPGPDEHVGIGSMAFKMKIGNRSPLNLGDSLFLADWEGLQPTVLMLPIGGIDKKTWTMEVDDAIQAVELIDPELVILSLHFRFLRTKKFAVADDARFKRDVEALGKRCRILGAGDVVTV